MEDIIHAVHCTINGTFVTYIPDVKLYFGILQVMTHVILLFLISGKYTDLLDIGIKKAAQNSITEGTCSTGNQ